MNPVNLPDRDGRVCRARQPFEDDVFRRVGLCAVGAEPVNVVIDVDGGVGEFTFDVIQQRREVF